MKHCIFFALVFQLCLSAAAQNAELPDLLRPLRNWQLTTLVNGGRIDAICDMGNGTVVCGTRHPNPGQLFISYNYGANWQPLAQLTPNAITCIAAANAKEWYVLTGNAEVYASRDAGKTWKLMATLTTNRNKENYTASYSIIVTYHGTVLVTDTNSEGGHIYRSVNKGVSFTDLGAVSGDALYRFNKVGNGIIVNGWQGNVYKSIDDGLTWNIVGRLTNSDLFATEYLGSHRVLQADKDGAIFRSNNLGEAWEQIGKLPDAADDFIDLGYGAVLYSTYTGKRHFHVSFNYGSNWHNLGAVSDVEGDWLDHGIRVDQPDSIIILAGTSKGHMMRKAIARSWLYNTVNSYNKREASIDAAQLKPMASAVLGSLVDFTELIDPEDIVVHKQFAYIPCRDGNNVAIINYANPAQPVLAYSLRDPDILDAFSVAVQGNELYVVSMTNCVVSVYNISNPYAPVKTGAIRVGGEGGYLTTYNSNYTRLRKIAVHGNYAYVTHSSESKLYILDISNPAKMRVVGSLHTGDGAFAVLPYGDEVVYLAGYGPGSSVIAVDVRNKKAPRISSRIYDSTLLAGTCALAIHNKVLYVVAYGAGNILSADISDAFNPRRIAYFTAPGMKGPGRIAIAGATAYVINSSNDSMIAIDITDPAKLKTKYFITDALIKKTYGIALDGDKLLLAGRDARSFVLLSQDALNR